MHFGTSAELTLSFQGCYRSYMESTVLPHFFKLVWFPIRGCPPEISSRHVLININGKHSLV